MEITSSQLQLLKDQIERTLTGHSNVVIEINRTEPQTFMDAGLPHVAPSWITQTIKITSKFYYEPQ